MAFGSPRDSEDARAERTGYVRRVRAGGQPSRTWSSPRRPGRRLRLANEELSLTGGLRQQLARDARKLHLIDARRQVNSGALYRNRELT